MLRWHFQHHCDTPKHDQQGQKGTISDTHGRWKTAPTDLLLLGTLQLILWMPYSRTV